MNGELLLVEYDPNWMDLEKRVLQNLGFNVTGALNATSAISALQQSSVIRLVISDLHMNGDNGDRILEHLMETSIVIPYVVASGTLCDRAKLALAEGIPGTFFFSKEDFLNPDYVRSKIEDVLSRPIAHTATETYLGAVRKAKNYIATIPEIMAEANHVKGLVFRLLSRHRTELGPNFEFLREVSYTGRTPEETLHTLHSLKNALTGIAHNNCQEGSALKSGLLSISDYLVQLINQPVTDSMRLDEFVDRLTANFDKIYPGICVDHQLPQEVRIKNPNFYWKIVYSLIENAVQQAAGSDLNYVPVEFNPVTNSMVIRNSGTFPIEWIDVTGNPILENLHSSKPFGTGYGIADCVRKLGSVGKKLHYKNDLVAEGVVTTIPLDVETINDNTIEVRKGSKPRVLFLDHTYGHRFTGMETVLKRLDKRFEYVWDLRLNLDRRRLFYHDLERVFLIVVHQGCSMYWDESDFGILFCDNMTNRTPQTRYCIISGIERDGTIQLIKQWHASRNYRKDAAGHIDFFLSEFPTSDGLQKLINESYQKYTASKPQ